MQERDIFIKAIQEDDAHKRSAVLDMSCRGDADLRQRVEQLLAEHAREDRFILDDPLITPDAAVIEPLFELTGTVIDRYELAELIGEGGFGVVYVAQQTTPVRRQVAVKIVKPGMDSRQVLARFEAERQTLALMDHPHIAKILDGGTTHSGRPYFVMELVKGVPVTDYCDRCQLGTRERLELFVSVCRAVQHAHQKKILHRDLKPSNVLVEMQDGSPSPKIIDFGVAKAIGQKLTEQTLRTQFAQMIGTPMYMSPEQAELSPIDVDTRTDVFSLGVILYELLTGQTPYTNTRLSEASFDELRRIIREEEPHRPSARVSTLAADASTTLAATHRIDSRRLAVELRGELDWIIMKALAKDRTRRYTAANDLAADIERYLRHEPILARPASTLYRVSKFTRRNRALVVCLAAVFVALSLGFALATAGFLTAQRRLAEVAREQEGNRILISMLRDIYGIPFGMETHGQQSTVRDSLDKVSSVLGERLRHHPKEEIEIRQIVANSYKRYAEPDKAREHLQRALELAEREYGPRHERVADVLTSLADEICWQTGESPFDHAVSQDCAEQALAIYDRIGVESPNTAHALFCLASSLRVDEVRHQEAESHLRRALRIAQDLASGKDTTPQVFAMCDLAIHIAEQHDSHGDEASLLIRQAVEMSQRIDGDQTGVTATLIAVQGDCFRHQGDAPRSLASYHQAWEMYKEAGLQTERKAHAVALTCADTYYAVHRHREATEVLEEIGGICRDHKMMDSLARCFYLRGWGELLREDYAAAEANLREAVSLAEENLGESHQITAFARFHLARSLDAQGRFAESRAEYQKLLTLTKQLLGLKHVSEAILFGHAWALLHGGGKDRVEEALDVAERGLARAKAWPQYGREPHLYLVKAIAQHEFGGIEQAVDSLRNGLNKIGLPSLRAHYKDVPKSRRELEMTLARYLVELGDYDDAEQVYRDGITAHREHLPEQDLRVPLAELRFGTFLLEHRRFESAEEQLLGAQKKLSNKNSEAADANRHQVATRLVALYTAWEKPAEAARWEAERAAVQQRTKDSGNAQGNRVQKRDTADNEQN